MEELGTYVEIIMTEREIKYAHVSLSYGLVSEISALADWLTDIGWLTPQILHEIHVTQQIPGRRS